METQSKMSFEYWDFHNLLILAQTKQKLSSGEHNGKSFVISGGAGNTLASLGAIYEYVNQGGKITSISGTSMGGAIAVLVGNIGNNANQIKNLMDDIENGFVYNGRRYSITKLNLYIPGVPLLAKKFIEQLLIKYNIGKDTTFGELKVPVVINSGRQYNNGEQEILLGGTDNIHDSVLASMNIPIPLTRNFGGIGRTAIDGVPMIDYAANERGNPTHWLKGLGVEEKDMIVVDAGYSSEEWIGGATIRKKFPRATIRDFLAKEAIRRKGGLIININPEIDGEGSGGKINPKRTRKLYELGATAIKQASTSPLSQ